jgi:hypothetical protein
MAGPGGSNPLRPIILLLSFRTLSLTLSVGGGGILTMLSLSLGTSNLLVYWLEWLFNHFSGIVENNNPKRK